MAQYAGRHRNAQPPSHPDDDVLEFRAGASRLRTRREGSRTTEPARRRAPGLQESSRPEIPRWDVAPAVRADEVLRSRAEAPTSRRAAHHVAPPIASLRTPAPLAPREAPAAPLSRRPEPSRSSLRASHPIDLTAVPLPPTPAAPASNGTGLEAAALTRRAIRAREREPRKIPTARLILSGGLTVGLAVGVAVYASDFSLKGGEAAFVVGTGVSAQTDELARARTVDTTYRAAASVSRNERRTAITVAGARNAAELEAKAKAEAARKAREAEIAEAKAEAARMRKRAIANARENPQAAARVLMVDHGWTSDAQYNCLVNLWNGESNWNYLAENPSSGAYGIPQSLPGSKMATAGDDWRTNPITQIKWGLSYIDERYGSPCNAWSTWQARSPHWY